MLPWISKSADLNPIEHANNWINMCVSVNPRIWSLINSDKCSNRNEEEMRSSLFTENWSYTILTLMVLEGTIIVINWLLFIYLEEIDHFRVRCNSVKNFGLSVHHSFIKGHIYIFTLFPCWASGWKIMIIYYKNSSANLILIIDYQHCCYLEIVIRYLRNNLA